MAKEPTTADLERDKIKLTGSTTEKEKTEEENTETEEEVETEETEEETTEEEAEKTEEEVKEEETEDETKTELTEDQKKIAKLERTVERLTKRVGKTSGEKAAIAKDLAAAKKSLEIKIKEGEQPLTEEEVERRSEDKANQKVAASEFKRAQNKLIKEATAIDKTFMAKVHEMAEEVSPLPGQMIGILEDIDNGGAVLNYLTDNVEEYEEIYQLSVVKMSNALNKIAKKLEDAAKPKPKQISKVPKPNEPIKGGNKSPLILTGKESMADFVRIRNQQAEERRKAKLR